MFGVQGGYSPSQRVCAPARVAVDWMAAVISSNLDRVRLRWLVKIFRDAGYPYMLMPDHAPYHPDETGKGRMRPSYAYQYGYIKALIQTVYSEVNDGS